MSIRISNIIITYALSIGMIHITIVIILHVDMTMIWQYRVIPHGWKGGLHVVKAVA
ncbi:MAG: hypothetical protein ACR5K2_00125 [Wolbachia sp.]